MIIKSFEISKINLKKNKFILLYGKNEGLKDGAIKALLKDEKEIKRYEEKEILDNSNTFVESIISQSLFENKKIIIIKRVTDKLIKVIEEVSIKNTDDTIIIFNAETLEKRSKLRTLFEKNKTFVSVAFYSDTNQTLSKLTYDFLREKKISISRENINFLINRVNGDRKNLLNELRKIEYFSKNGKKITDTNIVQLTNLIENHNISDLIDNCLSKNQKKTLDILNENNFNNEDCVVITRTFLNKTKKILKLSYEFQKNKNIELTISTARPPIFWKDKEITQQQIYKWNPEKLRQLIYKLNEVELLIKKNVNNSINLVTDFILHQVSSNTNN